MSFAISKRDPGLRDVSDKALHQLTSMLYMDTSAYFGDDAEAWLTMQEWQVQSLDRSLLRPKDWIARLAISMGKHNLPFCPERANLCPAHKALDPRVIRNLLLLVADECTIHANRYRSLRLRGKLTPFLTGWLDRIDFMTVLWMGEERYCKIFGRPTRYEIPDCVRTKCEACILAAIGGSAICLTDLRASLVARRIYVEKVTERLARDSRLLRTIDAWISFYQPACQDVLRECSESIVQHIVDMRLLVRERRGRYIDKVLAEGGTLKPERHLQVRLTTDGLPMPREPFFQERPRKDKKRRRMTVEQAPPVPDVRIHAAPEENIQEQRGIAIRTPRTHDRIDEVDEEEEEEEAYNWDEWEDWEEQEVVDEKEPGEEEYWVDDYLNLVLGDHENGTRDDDSETRDDDNETRVHDNETKDHDNDTKAADTVPDPPRDLGVTSRLSFGPNTRMCTDINTTASWTSKVDSEDSNSPVASPRAVQVPFLYRDSSSFEDDSQYQPPTPPLRPRTPFRPLTPLRPASSLYSTDPGYMTSWPFREPSPAAVAMPSYAPVRDNPFEKTLSMLSTFRRDSAVPSPLALPPTIPELPTKGVNRAALAKLEGRRVSVVTPQDRDVASCYGTMGWGGPRRE